MIKCKIFGYRGPFNNTNRIEKYLVDKLDCALVENDPDLLVHLTGGFENAEEFYNKCNKKPIRLYLLLDIDPDKPLSWYDNIKRDFANSEIPCVLTNTVKKDVEQKLGIKNLSILPYPIQPTVYLNQERLIDFIWSGRARSKNKRFQLGVAFLKNIGYDLNRLIIAGTEDPGVGQYVPFVDERSLNQLFNSARFLLSPSSSEGQNLNICQAVITRTIPIICNDCDVNIELGLKEFCADPNPISMAHKYYQIQDNMKNYISILDELAPKFEAQFTLKAVCERIVSLYKSYICSNI